MKTLQTLIRVHEWHLEEKRRSLVELETQRESITARLAKLEAEIAAEKAFVAQQVDDQYRMSALDFSYYHEDAKEKRADIQLELRFNGEAIVAAQNEVTVAYQELQEIRNRPGTARQARGPDRRPEGTDPPRRHGHRGFPPPQGRGLGFSLFSTHFRFRIRSLIEVSLKKLFCHSERRRACPELAKGLARQAMSPELLKAYNGLSFSGYSKSTEC